MKWPRLLIGCYCIPSAWLKICRACVLRDFSVNWAAFLGLFFQLVTITCSSSDNIPRFQDHHHVLAVEYMGLQSLWGEWRRNVYKVSVVGIAQLYGPASATCMINVEEPSSMDNLDTLWRHPVKTFLHIAAGDILQVKFCLCCQCWFNVVIKPAVRVWSWRGTLLWQPNTDIIKSYADLFSR